MKHYNLLLIDDDLISLELMSAFLETENFHLFTAPDGQAAYDLIMKKSPGFFSCIVSDVSMPNLDGIGLLKRLKEDENRKILPFILQTSDRNPDNIKKTLELGAFYYLIKPITRETLKSVVNAALKDYENHLETHNTVQHLMRIMPLMQAATFHYKTLDEAKSLSSLLALMTHDPKNVAIGFFEIFANAVEHGNLGITYDEKTALINQNQLNADIQRRLALPEYRDKFVTVTVNSDNQKLKVTITDMGDGFDFEKYLEFSIDRIMDNHGRGIMMAKSLSFDELIYSNGGRTVSCWVHPPMPSEQKIKKRLH